MESAKLSHSILRILGCATFSLLLFGCQQIENTPEKGIGNEDTADVVNSHGDLKNLRELREFAEKVKDKETDAIDYVEFGEEGQRGLKTLTTTDGMVEISHFADDRFIEEFRCEDLIVETEGKTERYTLIACAGDFNGDLELLSVPK
ncbi:DUF4362 domain-containing protein [Planomicrobium sp. CPCC 101110]|uniref:DUF4362 domain-containing protein n=1 Tax=Planomicrobium sp. CPCC 101110 TaxID=2599619 RepID=UPI0016478CFD|nr:DUF4362 domain-containing protein [Planomicrobium sp. CPCC 101110]